jgi:hypothetical protein
MTGWNNLPNELRNIVRGHIYDDVRLLQTSTLNPPSNLPLVNREFQHFFSHVNFRILVVDQHRLDDLERFLDNNNARQHTVEQIYLRVKLPEYDCSVCQTAEDDDTISSNQTLFYNTLVRLFNITSRWTDPSRQPWITLDIGVYSLSDGKHAFRDFRLSPAYHHGAEGDLYKRHRDQLASSSDDQCPGWQRVLAGKAPLMGSKRRLLSILTCPGCSTWSPQAAPCNQNLAVAPVFSTLHLSRHSYRRISAHLLSKITNALPGIRALHWETWQQPSWRQEYDFAEECASLMDGTFPASVRHLSLHHHTPVKFRIPEQDLMPINYERSPLLRSRVFRSLAGLESLGLSNIGDPAEFFSYGARSQHVQVITWAKLKHFVIASRIWRGMDQRYTIRVLAGAANLAFFRMPLLENLEVWCAMGYERLFLRFSYTDDRRPMIEWYSSFLAGPGLQNVFNVIRTNIMLRFPEKTDNLVVKRLEFEEADFSSFEDISRLSRNPELILLPESRAQLHFEEQFAYKREPPRKSRLSKV